MSSDTSVAPVQGVGTPPVAAPARRGAGRRLSALIVKESVQMLRDPSSILIAFVLPLILLFLFGYGVSLDSARVRIGLVMESLAPPAQDFAARFIGSRYFEVRVSRDRREFVGDLVAGRLRAIIVIPADFAAGVEGADSSPLQVITDGAEPNTATFVANYVKGVWANWQGEEGGRPMIEAVPRFWFNPELRSQNFLVPGLIAIVMTLIGVLLTALVVAREWERGTMEALMATPVTALELLAGKLVPYFLLGLASMALCTVLAVLMFDVPLRGSPLALLLLSSAFLAPALGQGLLISAATKNQFVASQLALISGFLPAFLLSGLIFEIDSMPPVIRAVTNIVPARYFIPSLQTVFLTGDVWPLFLHDIGVLLVMGAVLLALALRATRKRIA